MHKLAIFLLLLISTNVFADSDGMAIVDTYKIVKSSEQPGAYLLTINYKIKPNRSFSESIKYELEIKVYNGLTKIAEVDNIYKVGQPEAMDSVTVTFYPKHNAQIDPKKLTIKVEVDDIVSISGNTKRSSMGTNIS